MEAGEKSLSGYAADGLKKQAEKNSVGALQQEGCRLDIRMNVWWLDSKAD